MNENHLGTIARELGIEPVQVVAVSKLLEGGSTVPFIARYRKEATGSLDEVRVSSIRDRLRKLEDLDKRKEAILKSLEENGHLTEELKSKVLEASTLTVLEDHYLPFRPKRRTRAAQAREKGLEPLAKVIFAQGDLDPETEARRFLSTERHISSVEEALAGARDIIAEWISEDASARDHTRSLYQARGVLHSHVISGKEAEGAKYRDYFEWDEPISRVPSHRVLAMRRAEKEGILTLRISPSDAEAIRILKRQFVKGRGPVSVQVERAIEDGYSRLLSTSIETEIRLLSKARAEEEAISIFSENLRQLLMAAPLGEKNVMAFDPGFRTGCKMVCLDGQARLLHTDTVYPGQNDPRDDQAAKVILGSCKRFDIGAIAIGNGTGGRELESFIRGLDLPGKPLVIMVNESGASVYSASDLAREEFPDHDLTVRGSVSIGRRLMDPLSELVKIDPKSIGVGQYQHDVNQKDLKSSLEDVVTSCVNAVGVEVNTASRQLLTYVSGLGPQLAAKIVDYRDEHGPFPSRDSLKKVPRLGAKAFEQAAGFLRIRNAGNPLDASAVHPERYAIVDAIASDLQCTVRDLLEHDSLRQKIDPDRYLSEDVGLPTMTDILEELGKPGRDPREKFEIFSFAEGLNRIEDVQPGMVLPGIVTNITAFGAFVDVGVHQDGLVHISQLADRYVKSPSDVLTVHQKVRVTILNVDLERNRMALSMRKNPENSGNP